jgi:hypothetical protein
MDYSLSQVLYEGAPVKIHPRAPGHFSGQQGVVDTLPVHPITWFKVRFVCGTVATFRSSNLIPLDPDTGEPLLSHSRRGQVAPSRCSSQDVQVDSSVREKREKNENFVREISVKQSAVHKRTLANVSASFDAGNACRNCGAVRSISDKFCWNELCCHSPVYYQLPGCRGRVVIAATGLVEEEMNNVKMNIVVEEEGEEQEDSEDLSFHRLPVVPRAKKCRIHSSNRVRSHSDSISTDSESVHSAPIANPAGVGEA